MVGILPIPPPAPDHRLARWDPTAGFLESTVLATVHMWTLKHNKEEIVGHIIRNFLGTDVYQAMCELRTSFGQDKPSGHRNSAGRTAAELYASELCDMIVELSTAKKLPNIVMPSLCLSLVPVAVLKTNDEINISARLESMDIGMKKLTEAMVKISAGQRPSASTVSPAPPAVTVTRAQAATTSATPAGGPVSFAQAQAQATVTGNSLEIPSAPPASQEQMRSWAAAAAAAGVASGQALGGASGGVRPKVQSRDRIGSSSSQKRDREGEEQPFQQYQSRNQVRKQRKVAYGSSKVNVEEEGSAAPVEFYVGNTTTRATKEIIASVLVKCAKGLEPSTNFHVVEVEQLALHLVNPRTKCWKVIVPYMYKQLMENDELYPTGWTHRKFFGPRKSKENPAKHARMDDQLVAEVLKEQERKQLDENRQAEERQQREEATRLAEQSRLVEEAARLDEEMEEESIREEERVAADQLENELGQAEDQPDNVQQESDIQA